MNDNDIFQDGVDFDEIDATDISECIDIGAVNTAPRIIPVWNDSDDDEDELSECLLDMAEGQHSPTLYRDDLIEQIMAVLIGRDKPNALLVGPAGSGKTNIVEELACRIAKGGRKIPAGLRGCRIYSLSLSDIVSGCGLVGALEGKISALIDFLENPESNAILFIDEIHMMFSGETYKKVAQMLKPALGRGRIRVIAATTTQEVKKVDEDPAFNRRFTRVLVDELTHEQTEKIVEHIIPVMEEHYGIKIEGGAGMSKLIVKVADEFCSAGSHRPDNALTLLDRTVAGRVVKSRRKTVNLTKELVEETAYRMTSGNSVMRKLDEKALKRKLSRIRGQKDIIEDIMRVIKLHDMHVRPMVKPLTFLFAGPSGVGKSEIARILSTEYMGEKPIVLNMAEYNSSASINRIIGAPAGYAGCDSNTELPFDCLDTNPYRLILLDEFEKCDRSVQRLFMSAFDEGTMKTNFGKEIDFSKAIIIATTNAGCTAASNSIGFGACEKGSELSVTDLAGYFDVELLNRFSHRYTFSSIDREIYTDVVRDTYIREMAMIDRSRANIGKELPEVPSDKILDILVARSYQPKLGARPAQTAVTEYIDNIMLGVGI